MKTLKKYIEECNLVTPMNTVGIGDIQVTPEGSTDPLVITGKPRKLKKIKKKKINESKQSLSELLEYIIEDEDFIDNNYSIFDDYEDDEELRIKLIDGYCMEVCIHISDYYKVRGIEYYLLDDKGDDFHFLMRYKKLWYDGYNFEGVDKLENLKFIELNKSYHKYDEGELHNHLHLISKNKFDYDKAMELKNN